MLKKLRKRIRQRNVKYENCILFSLVLFMNTSVVSATTLTDLNLGNTSITGTIDNSSSVTNSDSITITTSGTITNETGASITNKGTSSTNSSNIDNLGSIYNAGTITNDTYGMIDNEYGATITNNGTSTTNSFIYFSYYSDNFGTISNGSHGTIINRAHSMLYNGIYNVTSSTYGLIDNYGSITNEGNICNNISGTITNESSGTINNNGTSTTDASITNNGSISNAGTITNDIYGNITNESGASITNNGTSTTNSLIANSGFITNAGTITNGIYGTITNESGASITNNGTSSTNRSLIHNSGSITNAGTITNDIYGTISNYGTITNNKDATIDNSGTIANIGGSIDNYGTITNESGGIIGIGNNGTITNESGGTITNNKGATIDNSGVIANKLGGTIDNYGTITNESGSIIGNYGTISNSGTIDNLGTITITDGIVSGSGTILIQSGGDMTVSGGIVSVATQIKSGGKETISGGTVSNITLDSGTLSISGGTVSDITENSGDLYVSGGIINLFSGTSVGKSLTVTGQSGNATYVINTDVATNHSDSITINGTSSYGHNTVKVNYDPSFATGKTVSGNAVFATTQSKNVTFTSASTEYGAHSYLANVSSPDGYMWSITGFAINNSNGSGASETVYSGLDNIAGALSLWNATHNNITQRMGDLRSSTGTTGEWARVYAGQASINGLNNRQTTESYRAIQGGYDTKHQGKYGTWFNGYALGYLRGDSDLNRGSGTNSTASVGVYASWLGNKGHYFDLIAKEGRVNTSYNSYLNDASSTKVAGDYGSWATSLSAEYGYRKKLPQSWYFEPQAEVNWARVGSADYTTSDGVAVHNDSATSLIGRIGLAIGKEVNANNFYFKTSLEREFKGNPYVTMTASGSSPVSLSENLKDTWVEFDLGWTANYTSSLSNYLELTRTAGGKKFSTPWQINIGIRKTF